MFEYFNEAQNWFNTSNYLTTLSVKSESDLIFIRDKLINLGIKISCFYEPDINNQLTSVSFLETKETKKLTSSLPLCLKNLQGINKHSKINNHDIVR